MQGKPFVNDSIAFIPFPDQESIVKTVNIDSSDPAHHEMDGVKTWRFNIAAEGCGSARFNIKPFDMAPGDYIVVYGLNHRGRQTEIERSEGKGWRELGEVNSLRVWARELLLEMHASSPHSHFITNYVHYADCFQDRPGMPTICGDIDWRNIICYSETPGIMSLGPSVFRLRFVRNRRAYKCTAWKASVDGRFLTNFHCLGNQVVTSTAELDYMYDSKRCHVDVGSPRAVYSAGLLIQTSGSLALDFSIFTVKQSTAHIPCLLRTNSHPNPDTQYMIIIHHPHGKHKKVSVKSDQDRTGYCQLAPCYPHNRPNNYCFFCDAIHGSSGSPIFFWLNQGRMAVFALLQLGGCPNGGVKMSLVSQAAGSNLGVCT